MTDDVKPPLDYGGDEWADGGDYYVPADLRTYYAAAEPTDQELAIYMHGGVEVSVPVTLEHTTALPGAVRMGQEPAVVTESFETRRLKPLNGAEGYREWLHIIRVDHAVAAKRRAEQDAARQATYSTCGVCGERSPSVTAGTLWTPSAVGYAYDTRHPLTACPDCAPVLVARMRERVANLDAERVLADGRTVGEAVADYIAALVPEAGEPTRGRAAS